MSHKLVQELLEKSPLQELNLVIELTWQVWALDAQLKKLEEELKHPQSDPNENLLAPGWDLRARILSNELGDMSQFNNERQLFSYGVDPLRAVSGDNIRKGTSRDRKQREFGSVRLCLKQSEQTGLKEC